MIELGLVPLSGRPRRFAVVLAQVETPLHFDERENLFFQVRGHKDKN